MSVQKNIDLNRLALGTVQFGLPYGISNCAGQVQESEVAAILEFARGRGVGLLDTAAAYGESEEVLGRCLGGKDSFQVVSKLAPGSGRAGTVQEQLKITLEKLRLDKLYGYLFHSFDDLQKSPSLWGEFERLKGSLVEKIGVSVYRPEELEWMFDQGLAFDLVQLPFNLLDRRFEYLFEELKSRDIELHVRSVFLQGLFFMEPERLDSFFEPIKPFLLQLGDVAKQCNTTIDSLSLQFALANQQIDKIVIGVTSVAELKENIEAAGSCIGDLSLLPEVPTVGEELLIPAKWPRS